jgi:iron complex outermembrane recepter protein
MNPIWEVKMIRNCKQLTGRVSSIALIVAALIVASPAHAQTSEPVTEGIQDIVVTARKRSENIQETPLSVTAATGAMLAAQQVDASTDLTRITPNLQFLSQSPASGNNASAQIFIRGIGQTDFLPSTDPGVGLYIDGVYVARSVGGALDFADVERVEVLRGPQGTLFGRNTIGGAINIITVRPGDELGGAFSFKTGSYNRYEGNGSLNIPLGSNAAARVTGGFRKRDGYVKRLSDGILLGNDNSVGGRLSLRWDLTDDFKLSASVDYSRDAENGAPTVFNSINPTQAFARIASGRAGCPAIGPAPAFAAVDAALLASINDPRCANNNFAAGPFATRATARTESFARVWGTQLTADWDLGAVDFKWISAYRDLKWRGARDADNTPLTILHTDIKNSQWQASQELQFSGYALDERIKWLLGGYYFFERSRDNYDVPVTVGTFELDGNYENESLATFFQATFEATDRLSFTVGGRYSDERRAFTPNQGAITDYLFPQVPGFRVERLTRDGVLYTQLVPTTAPVGSAFPIVGPNVSVPAGTRFYTPGERKLRSRDFAPMGSMSYKFSDDIFGYVTYSEGFKAGGHSTRSTRPFLDIPEFRPESARSYEVGLKTDWFDRRLRLNGALFQTDYSDIQIIVREGFAPIVINGGKARIRGGELEWQIEPISLISINGGLGYNNNKYRQLSAAALGAGFTTNSRLALSPEWTINNGVMLNIPFGNFGALKPRLDWTYQSAMFFDAENTGIIAQPAYSRFNASVRLAGVDDRWNLTVAVTNLTDKLYRVSGFSALGSAAAYAESTFARPREWSLSLGAKF